jgi:hypothetical protein
MPIYRIENEQITAIARTTFGNEGLKERQDLQQMLKSQIDIISPDTLVVAEEFGDWEDSRRRIDLLGIDKNANLIVVELKRTEDGGYMDLQAIRYASMISTLTFDKLVHTYARFLSDNDSELNARESLLNFLEWPEPDEDQFGQEVKIVLASAEFSKELTTSVMWLNDFGIDIRCVRMHPYANNGDVLLDVQTVIPIPEVADYQIRIREKKQKEREARSSNRDFTKFNVSVAGQQYEALSKRWMMFHIISQVIEHGISPIDVQRAIDLMPQRGKKLFEILDGELDASEVYEKLMIGDTGGRVAKAKRFFSGEGEYFCCDNKTYVLTNQWGKMSTVIVDALAKQFPHLNIEIRPE